LDNVKEWFVRYCSITLDISGECPILVPGSRKNYTFTAILYQPFCFAKQFFNRLVLRYSYFGFSPLGRTISTIVSINPNSIDICDSPIFLKTQRSFHRCSFISLLAQDRSRIMGYAGSSSIRASSSFSARSQQALCCKDSVGHKDIQGISSCLMAHPQIRHFSFLILRQHILANTRSIDNPALRTSSHIIEVSTGTTYCVSFTDPKMQKLSFYVPCISRQQPSSGQHRSALCHISAKCQVPFHSPGFPRSAGILREKIHRAGISI